MTRLKRKNNKIILNNQTRLFIKVRNRNSCCSQYEYHACAALGDISKTRSSERTKIYAPSDSEYNKFDIVSEIVSNEINGSSTISTNYRLGNSILEKLFDENCLFDAQIHIGQCTNPSIFHEFEQIIVLEGIDVTNYNIAGIFAAQQADVAVVTENIDFTYETMYSFYPPKPEISVISPILNGPIIDSFTNCDQNCCLCPENVGTFLVQLEICTGFDCDCTLPDCIKPRILYRTNCKSDWQVYQIAEVGDILCETPLNRNVMFSDTAEEFYYVYLNNTFGSTLKPVTGTVDSTILQNSLITIPENFLPSGTLYAADGDGVNVILVGNANIIRYNTNTKQYYLIANTDAHQCIDVDFANYNTVYISTSSGYVLKLNLDDDSLTAISVAPGLIHHVQATSCCSFVAAIEDDLYSVCDGIVIKSTGLVGTVTALKAVNENILYVATFTSDGVNKSWVSVDAGFSFMLLSDSENLTTNISACENKPNSVTFAGHFNPTGLTQPDLQVAAITVDCTEFEDVTGFILEDNKC